MPPAGLKPAIPAGKRLKKHALDRAATGIGIILFVPHVWPSVILEMDSVHVRAVFLNRRAAAPYRALASIIPGRERFSWNLSF